MAPHRWKFGMDVSSHHRSLSELTQPPGLVPECVAFGELLRGARERRGMSLEHIANETKIPRRHLESLERGQLTAVPGGTYTRGEVIAYAIAVRLDRQIALAHLERALHPASDGAATSTRSQPRGRQRRLLTAGALAAGVLTILATLVVRQLDVSSTEPPRDVPRPGAPVEPAASRDSDVPRTPSAVTPSEVTTGAPGIESTRTVQTEATGAIETEPPVTPAGDTEGRLMIRTEPAGARVTMDGIGRGVTPLLVAPLSSATVRLRVTLPGYRADERTVRVQRRGETTVSITLHPVVQPEPPRHW